MLSYVPAALLCFATFSVSLTLSGQDFLLTFDMLPILDMDSMIEIPSMLNSASALYQLINIDIF
jgi:hypothetical protein